MPNNDVDLLTTREASEILGEGVRQTIRRVERRTLTPARKLSGLRGSYLFRRSDILALATSPSVPVSSPGAEGAPSVERKAS